MEGSSSLKDKAASFVVEQFVKKFISDFGSIDGFKIDSANKRLSLAVTLKGEPEIVRVDVVGYKIINSGNTYFLKLHHISTSKEWLTIVISKYYLDRRIEIPSRFLGVIKFLF
jgi:hypothetical protein